MTNRMRDKIYSMRVKGSERDRLLQMLDYYQWLESVGLSWDVIKGVRKQVRGMRGRETIKADWLLKDGTTLLTEWPPFPDDVIYNRSRLDS